jgi:hypothetical protein
VGRESRSRGRQVVNPSAAYAEPRGDLSPARTYAPVRADRPATAIPSLCDADATRCSSRARSRTSWRMGSGVALPTVDGMRHRGDPPSAEPRVALASGPTHRTCGPASPVDFCIAATDHR